MFLFLNGLNQIELNNVNVLYWALGYETYVERIRSYNLCTAGAIIHIYKALFIGVARSIFLSKYIYIDCEIKLNIYI